ncbi:MAG: DNA polymerase IV, partial [Proteobacteria bacterium]|nr:DNA polymerase IV [Pseudomonadota bacterium]
MEKKETDRIIFHIDVNSAYLSWEAVYRLQHGDMQDLRKIPSVVGGDSAKRHGIVLAKSIPAKKYGIHTGNGLWEAKNKCGNLVIAPTNYGLYMECSNAMVEILKQYSPIVERYSIDECFLDVTHSERYAKDPVKTAHTIKNRIKKELGFTVNIGISCNKLLAKVASEFKKPDEVHTLFPGEMEEKFWPLPVRELFMVGFRTAPKLRRLNIVTIGDLAHANPE